MCMMIAARKSRLDTDTELCIPLFAIWQYASLLRNKYVWRVYKAQMYVEYQYFIIYSVC